MNRLMLDLNTAISNLLMLETAIVVVLAVVIAWAIAAIATFMLLLKD